MVIDILLIEDNPHDADLVLRAIKKKNLEVNVVHVEDGVEAIDYLFSKPLSQCTKHIPRLILTDLKLPRLNGLELLKKIKSQKELQATPVVFFTSSREYKDIQECYASGANAYIVKPYNYKEYTSLVYKTISFWLKVNHYPSEI